MYTPSEIELIALGLWVYPLQKHKEGNNTCKLMQLQGCTDKTCLHHTDNHVATYAHS